jgi:molybdenum cofactor biosynthesis enzyme MoaA
MDNRTIEFGKCCVINELEDFGHISFDEFYNLSDFWSFVNFRYNILPANHHFETCNHTFCNGDKICDWRNEELKEIRVNINSCNLNCIMCHNDHSYTKESMEVYFHILNLIKGHNLNKIILTTGGEPFLKKNETIEYIESLKSTDCKRLEIITNATLLNENDIMRIKETTYKNGISCKIQVSLDSTDKDIYCKIRNATEKQYETVMRNIDKLHETGLLYGINIVMMPENERTCYNDCLYWKKKNIYVHILPIRYDNGIGSNQIKDTIEKIKKDFPEFYGDA